MKTVKVMTIDGNQTVFDIDQITDFASGIRGRLLLAGDHGYDQARQIWNGIFDKKPAIIMRCVGTSDVVRAVNFARANRLLLSVKGGGHNSAGTAVCEDGLMIDLSPMMVIRHAPPLPFLPEEVHGKLVVVVPFVYLGAQSEGEKLLKPLREATPAHGEIIGMKPREAWQSTFDALVPHGARNYWKSHQLMDLSDGCVDKIIEYGAKLPTEECEVFIPHLEGAAGRVPESETAFAHRQAPFLMNIHTRWQNVADDERCLEWVRAFHTATGEFSKGVYVNFVSQEGEERVMNAYTPQTWDRLKKIKFAWDPDNLFRINQNIKPSPQ